MMVLLVVYATADLISSSATLGVVLASSLCVALLQWTLKNPLISIFAGSLLYALLI